MAAPTRSRRRRSFAFAAILQCLGIVASARRASAAETPPTEPEIHVTIPWVLTQLAPSPGFAVDARGGGATFALAWQVTPLLWSWGIHRGLSPWRTLVVEPYVRQSGSLELFVSPELYAVGPTPAADGCLRGGVRSYFPLVEHGEYLSASIGASVFDFQGKPGAAYELGAYVLFGALGLQTTVSPTGGPLALVASLHLRYF